MATSALLNCAVCEHQLQQPVTLSCGYTVCFKCLPNLVAFQQSTFKCPVPQCKSDSHLFGPDILVDDVMQKMITEDFIHEKEMNESIYKKATEVLQCSIGNHLLESPVTNHCGHTFCKLCLLQYKITNDSCNKCQKRLPSYQFIHRQPVNIILDNILQAFSQFQPRDPNDITRSNQISNTNISFRNLNQTSYRNIPIYLTEFTVLPSQKLRLPVYGELGKKILQSSLLSCKEYQFLCFGILCREKASMKGHFGTIVRITSIEQRMGDLLVDVRGVDRFQVTSVNKESEDLIIADLEMKFEAQDDLQHFMTESKHWSDRKPQSPPSSPMDIDTVTNIPSPTSETPRSPPMVSQDLTFDSPAVKLSLRVHNFISELAHSTPNTSFCSAVEGLLGPVWLNSVQGLHGPLPQPENAVAMCWWAAVVLPVSNNDRYHLLETLSLTDRLDIILSWINDIKSQWGNCRRTVINSAAKVGQ
ncbi:unnamed protein product [Mucor hiemalis]